MPKSKGDIRQISNEIRRLLVHHKFSLKNTADEAYRNCFIPGDVKENTIEVLWQSFDNMNDDEINLYMNGGMTKCSSSGSGGRKRTIEHLSEEELYLKQLVEENLSTKLRIITAEFHEWFYTYHQDMTLPSLSSVLSQDGPLGLKIHIYYHLF